MKESISNMSPMELRDYLEHNSDSQLEQTYFRPFNQAELDDARRQHSELQLSVDDINEQFSQVKKEFATKIKDAKKNIGATLKSIRLRGIEETGRCYIFKDYENRTVSTYNRLGVVINVRPMTPEESQLRIDDPKVLKMG